MFFLSNQVNTREFLKLIGLLAVEAAVIGPTAFLAGSSRPPEIKTETKTVENTKTTTETATLTVTSTSTETTTSTTTKKAALERPEYDYVTLMEHAETKISNMLKGGREFNGVDIDTYYLDIENYPDSKGKMVCGPNSIESEINFYTPSFRDAPAGEALHSLPYIFKTKMKVNGREEDVLGIDIPAYRKFKSGRIDVTTFDDSEIGIKTVVELKPETVGVRYTFVGSGFQPVSARVHINGNKDYAEETTIPCDLLENIPPEGRKEFDIYFNKDAKSEIPKDAKQVTVELRFKTDSNSRALQGFVGEPGLYGFGDLGTLGYWEKMERIDARPSQ